MNVLIYTQSYYVRNIFVNALLSAGINLYHEERPENLNNKILQHSPEIVILEVIHDDFATVFELVKQIKKHSSEEVKKTAIILLIGSIDKQDITSAIQCSVIGFIKSNSTEDFVYKYIMDTYQKVLGVPPERKYVRVIIDHNDSIGIKFRSPNNSQLIIGQVKDISLGGIAVELIGTFPQDSFTVGSEIKNMQFILDGKDIFIDGVIVAYQKKFCAFLFVGMSSEIKETISQYIFKKIALIEEEIKVSKTETIDTAVSGEKENPQGQNNDEQDSIV